MICSMLSIVLNLHDRPNNSLSGVPFLYELYDPSVNLGLFSVSLSLLPTSSIELLNPSNFTT